MHPQPEPDNQLGLDTPHDDQMERELTEHVEDVALREPMAVKSVAEVEKLPTDQRGLKRAHPQAAAAQEGNFDDLEDLEHFEPTPSQATLEKRIRRCMAPNLKGQYRVAEHIRKMWADGQKDNVLSIFAECGNDPKTFMKHHKIRVDQEKEMEVGVYFTFKTETELAQLSERLGYHIVAGNAEEGAEECEGSGREKSAEVQKASSVLFVWKAFEVE